MAPDTTPVLGQLRVLRLGSSLSGDFLSAILTDAGAVVTCAASLDEAATGAAAAGADVIVDDLGRGVAQPAVVAQALRQRAAEPVVCSLVSFPAGGPEGLPELEDDPVLAVLGVNRMTSDAPVHEPLRMPSLYAAQLAALYIGAALLQRLRGGPASQRIEVSLFGAALNVLGRQLVAFDDARYRDPLSFGHRLPVAEPRRCADGRYIQPHGMFPHFAAILMTVGGHPEWAEAAANSLYHLPDAAAVALWNERMDAMFLRRSAAEWERLINEAGGACTMCRTRDEWAREPHAQAAGMLGPGSGEGKWQVGPGIVLETSRAAGPRRAPEPVAPAKPLSGLRVVDFCIIIAGPTVGRLLADLGADVVKIDAPNRYVNPCLWMDVNRGKRSIVLDLRNAAGREVAASLVDDADVIIENFRAGKLEQLGFGYDEVSRRRPDVIYASTNAMDLLGPWAPRPGWEHNAQAASGMQWARSHGAAPLQVPFPVNDYATGLFGALGIVWALLHRQRTGQGARVRGSLARSATYLQRFDGPMQAMQGRREIRTLRCADGWVSAYLAPDTMPDHATWDALAARCESLPCTATQAELASHGWPAARENKPADLLREQWLFESGLMVRWDHPTLGLVAQGTPHAVNSAWPYSAGHPAPEPGADAAALLAEIGMGEAAAGLGDAQVVSSFPLFRAAGA